MKGIPIAILDKLSIGRHLGFETKSDTGRDRTQKQIEREGDEGGGWLGVCTETVNQLKKKALSSSARTLTRSNILYFSTTRTISNFD